MSGQSVLPSDKPLLHLQVETEQAALAQHVVSQRSTRLMRAGIGLFVLAMIGVSACALLPRASRASAKPSRLASEVAFLPVLPGALAQVRQRRPAISAMRMDDNGEVALPAKKSPLAAVLPQVKHRTTSAEMSETVADSNVDVNDLFSDSIAEAMQQPDAARRPAPSPREGAIVSGNLQPGFLTGIGPAPPPAYVHHRPGRGGEKYDPKKHAPDGSIGFRPTPPPGYAHRRPGTGGERYDPTKHGPNGAPRVDEAVPAGPAARYQPPRPQGQQPPQYDASRAGFGAPSEETAMPGREKEYEEFMESGGAQWAQDQLSGAVGASPTHPAIDEDRKARSAGLARNFYDTPTSDFKRPYGFSGAAPPEPDLAPTGAPPQPSGEAPQYSASLQFMITHKMKAELNALGYDASEIDRMEPATAATIINQQQRPSGPGAATAAAGYGAAPAGYGAPPAGRGAVPAGWGEETPMPGREKEYEENMKNGGVTFASGPPVNAPPIDEDRKARSAGLARNFYDTPTSDFKRPYGFSGVAPPEPDFSQPPEAAAVAAGYGAAPAGYGAPPAGRGTVPAGYGEETPMPGREKEYEENMKNGGVTFASGPPMNAPPLDEDRKSRSAGIARNFFDTPTSDFKRPHGFSGALPPEPDASSPPEMPTAAAGYGAAPAGYGAPPAGYGAPPGGRGAVPAGYGEETPMPGREKEYEENMKNGGVTFASGPPMKAPPIDEDRKARSAGLARNFYDTPTSDFKRPYGFSGVAPPEPDFSQPPEAAAAAAGYGAAPAGYGAPPAGYSSQSPMPGHENEHEELNKQEFSGAPLIDNEHGGGAPGLAKKLLIDAPAADLKQMSDWVKGATVSGFPTGAEPQQEEEKKGDEKVVKQSHVELKSEIERLRGEIHNMQEDTNSRVESSIERLREEIKNMQKAATKQEEQLRSQAADPGLPVPPGWKRHSSRSRPGQYAYENMATGVRYKQPPPMTVGVPYQPQGSSTGGEHGSSASLKAQEVLSGYADYMAQRRAQGAAAGSPEGNPQGGAYTPAGSAPAPTLKPFGGYEPANRATAPLDKKDDSGDGNSFREYMAKRGAKENTPDTSPSGKEVAAPSTKKASLADGYTARMGSTGQTGEYLNALGPPTVDSAPIDNSAVPAWVGLTQRQDVYFSELDLSVPLLEATNQRSLAEAYAKSQSYSESDDTQVARLVKDMRMEAALWPASFVAAKSVLRLLSTESCDASGCSTGEGKQVLELDCGVGLPSLAALKTGASVTSAGSSPVSLDLVSQAVKLQKGRETRGWKGVRVSSAERHQVEKYDELSTGVGAMHLDRLAEMKPDIVVASEVHHSDPQKAAAIGRFMGAAAARGAGVVVVASMFLKEELVLQQDGTWEGRTSNSAESWTNFFKAFNEAVCEFYQGPDKISEADLASFEQVWEAKIIKTGPDQYGQLFGRQATFFEMDIGFLNRFKAAQVNSGAEDTVYGAGSLASALRESWLSERPMELQGLQFTKYQVSSTGASTPPANNAPASNPSMRPHGGYGSYHPQDRQAVPQAQDGHQTDQGAHDQKAVLKAQKDQLQEQIDAAAGAGDYAKANLLMQEQKVVETAMAELAISAGGIEALEAAKKKWKKWGED